jgi:hypothetical protein
MAALESECRSHQEISLVYGSDLPQLAIRAHRREPFRWTVDLPGKRRVGVVPDKVFALDTTRSDGNTSRMIYFLEADRGTMPVERRDLRQSCLLRKAKAYEATHASARHREWLGARRFCLLMLMAGDERREHVRAAFKSAPWLRVIGPGDVDAILKP